VPIDVTPAGMIAIPAQPVCPVTTLFEIVSVPVVQFTVSAQAGGPAKLVISSARSAAMLSLRRGFIFFQSCDKLL
jgi:hypothetical protein